MLQWMEQLVRAELEDTATGRAASAPGKRAPAREARLAPR
jgi:hypothetical protein